MGTNRSRSWLPLLVLLIGALVVAIRGLECGPSGSTDAEPTAARGDVVSQSASVPIVASTEDDVADGTTPDGLSLVGRVIYPDGRPASGASVRLLSRPSGAPHASMARRVAVVDADGAFAFAKQAQGDYMLEAQTHDAVSPSTPARLVPGAEPVTLMVFPGAALAVRVLSAVNRKPISGATVKLGVGLGLFGASDAYVLERTDGEGVARFQGVARITDHPVYAIADGFAGTFDNIRASEHLLAAWDATLLLEPGADVGGRVVDERGRPIAGAKVGWEPGPGEPDGSYTFVTPLADGGHYIAAITDSAGAFRKTVPPGLGCLVAVHARYLTAQACGVRTSIGVPRGGVEIVMKSGARITGVVVTADGKPAPRAEVIVTQPSWEHIPRLSDSYRSRTTTDADGRFVFDGVDPTPLALTAWSDEASSDLVELDLRGVTEQSDVRITLAHRGVITGTVIEEDGGPAPFAVVTYFLTRDLHEMTYAKNEAESRGFALPRSIGGTLCDAEGKFRLAGLPPGKYGMRAQRPSATSVTPEFSAAWRYDVRLGSDVTIVLPGLGTVTGRIVDANDQPIMNFSVAFAIWEPAMQTASMPAGQPVTSADGKFRLDNIPANRYVVAASSPGFVEARTNGSIQVRGGNVTDVGTLKLSAGTAITGRVLSRAGTPVGNADVAMATAEQPNLLLHADSDVDGRFTLPILPRGSVVRVRASTQQTASDWIDVPAGASTVDIVLNDPASGRVRGVIIDPGHSIDERVVALTLPGIGTPGEGLKPEALTNALDSGRFALDNIPSGAYVLWVRRAQGTAGDEWATRAITVEPTKETSVVINLSQESPP